MESVAPAAPAESAPAAARSSWQGLVGDVVPLLAVLTAVAYTVVNVSYERFYAQFGVSPDDVGANTSNILADSGSRLLVYATLFALVPYGIAIGAYYLALTRLPVGRLRWAVAILVAVAALAIYQKATGGGVLGGYVGVVAGALVVVSLWVHRKTVAGTNWRALLLLWFGFGVVWLTTYYLPHAAARAGDCLVQNPAQGLRYVHTRRSLPGGGPTGALHLPVEPVDVIWLGEPTSRPRLGRHVLYLGRSGATSVLYDAATATAVRVPSSSIVIATEARPPLCRDSAWRG